MSARTLQFHCENCRLTFHFADNNLGHVTNLVDVCPECDGETKSVACEACGMHSPDLDDLCRDCVASNYLHGIWDLEADRKILTALPVWADVEQWVAAKRAEWDAEIAADRTKVVASILAQIGEFA